MSAVHGNKSYAGVWVNKSGLCSDRWGDRASRIAGVHRNHHFDTIQRLHPLNTGDAPLHPGIGLDYSSFYGGLQSRLSFHKKRDINAPRSMSLSSYYNSLVKHQIVKLKF